MLIIIIKIIILKNNIKNLKLKNIYEKFKIVFLQYERLLQQYQQIEEESEGSENELSKKRSNPNKANKCRESPIYNFENNMWIIKPGENSNRGHGIAVLQDMKDIEYYISGKAHTYIIQKYIEHPLLFKKRKFDIRCFALLTSVNGLLKGYYYQEGYLRTSSKEFSVSNFSKSVHLTNEAIQIKYEDFGKHEAGNKISYTEFQHYLEQMKAGIDLYRDIIPKIKSCICDTIKAVYFNIDRKRRMNTFELFGYDFMIDEKLKVYLIEVNINPCLEVTSSFSSRFVTSLIDNTFRIAVDPLFPPPEDFISKKTMGDILPEIKYELIFDQRVDSRVLEELFKSKLLTTDIEMKEESESSDLMDQYTKVTIRNVI